MQITVLQENLKQSLSSLQKVIPNKPQMAILSSILLRAEENHLQIFATDLYLGIKTEVVVEVKDPGSLVVDGETFKSFINSLPPGKIELSLKDNSLLIQQGKLHSKMSCQNAEEYPQFPEVKGDEFSLPLQDLEKIQNRVSFCASNDQTRPILTSLLMKFSEKSLEVVATDGFRLAQLFLKEHDFVLEKTLLVPVKALSELYRISKQQKEDTLRILVSEELKQLLFKVSNVEMYVRLIEGEYPPYEKIIPPEFRLTVEFDTQEFLQELKRALIFSRDSSNIVRLEIQEDNLIVRSSSPSFGEYQGEISLKNKNKETGKIAFNVHYLIDFISSVVSETVQFSMNESLKPAEFKDLTEKDFLYIAMPFRVND